MSGPPWRATDAARRYGFRARCNGPTILLATKAGGRASRDLPLSRVA
jgi:hypothetical protein